MYTEFLNGLAKLSTLLDEAAKIGGDLEGMPVPYLFGKVEVRLDGSRVGYFEFVDEYVTYHEDEESA